MANKRKETLETSAVEDLEVKVPLRQRTMKDLIKKLKTKEIPNYIADTWTTGNSDRAEYLSRLNEYMSIVDEFIDPIYDMPNSWSSNLHLPTILTVSKTYHARMQQALMGIEPPFTVKSRTAANSDRAELVQELMKYTIKDWINHYQGIDTTVDRWLWDWTIKGCGILKGGWLREFSTYIDVEDVLVPGPPQAAADAAGNIVSIPTQIVEEREIKKTVEIFNGPTARRLNVEDLLIVGGEGDPQLAELVIEQDYMDASELWSLVDQGIFDEKAVANVIDSGRNYKQGEMTNDARQRDSERAGEANIDKSYEKDKFQILEAYIKVDVFDSGIDADLIVWIHPSTREVLRATYLRRVMPTGMRPYFKIDFHLRNNTTYGVGLAELLYSLGREIDAIHNIRMDVGIIQSMPFGFYRPTASQSPEVMSIEPGALIPLDNPGQDVFFPNVGNKVSFGFQEEAALMNQVERLTSVSDLSLGIMSGSQGAARTATGARALVGETSVNLDAFLRRLNRGWKQYLKYVFTTLQDRLPEGFQFRLLGDDGHSYWQQIESKEEIAGLFDFELDPNSANSNPQIQKDTANLIFQVTQNPLLLQLGIVSQLNLYEAAKQVFQVNGIKNFARFLTKPQGQEVIYSPAELANLILRGVDVPLSPVQDLQGFIAYVEEIKADDTLLGQFNREQVIALELKNREAQQLLAALQAQKAQQANILQQQMNSNAAGVQFSPEVAEVPTGIPE